MTGLFATVRIAAKARHPPASEVDAVLTPVIPSCPRATLTLYATPATGNVTFGMATIWRNAGICRARTVSRHWSLAVLTVAGSAPLASAYLVPRSPSARRGVHLRHERSLRAGVPKWPVWRRCCCRRG